RPARYLFPCLAISAIAMAQRGCRACGHPTPRESPMNCRPATVTIDFDGTIAATNVIKSHWFLANLGLRIPAYLCDRTSCLPLVGDAAYSSVSAYLRRTSVIRSLPPVPGSLKALRHLS